MPDNQLGLSEGHKSSGIKSGISVHSCSPVSRTRYAGALPCDILTSHSNVFKIHQVDMSYKVTVIKKTKYYVNLLRLHNI